MKELEFKQTSKVVKDYITERFVECYVDDYKPSDWEKHSNGDLEKSLDEMNVVKKGISDDLKGLFDQLKLTDENTNEDIIINSELIDHYIKTDSWYLIYQELEDEIDGCYVGEESKKVLNSIVDFLDDLISLENTYLHVMEILTSRVGLEERITYISK